MNPIKKEKIPLRMLASGDMYHLNVFNISPKLKEKNLPLVHIQASVHGSEVQGNATIYWLLDYLSKVPIKARFQIIPCANPCGLNLKMGEYTFGRFEPSDGNNWNRSYFLPVTPNEKSRSDSFQINLEKFIEKEAKNLKGKLNPFDWQNLKLKFKVELQRAIELKIKNCSLNLNLDTAKLLTLNLQKLSAQSDCVLDLHTAPISVRYLYASSALKFSAQQFKIPYIIFFDPQFSGAKDEVSFYPWWLLNRALFENGIMTPLDFESYTVEEGSQELINLHDAQNDAQNIIDYLKFKGYLDARIKNMTKLSPTEIFACDLKDYKGHYAPMGGLVHYEKKPGDFVKKNEIMCQILNFNSSKFLTPVKSLYDGFVINHAPSSILHHGMEMIHLMTNFKKLS
jgi:predicted deacylase